LEKTAKERIYPENAGEVGHDTGKATNCKDTKKFKELCAISVAGNLTENEISRN